MAKAYEDLTLTDDFMFCKIMQNNEEIAKRFVEIIIGRKIGGIVQLNKQKPIEITSNNRGIRMDVYMEDDHNTIYNVEMQNSDTKNIAMRARYYQSMLDVDYMDRGVDFDELKRSYIIFINNFDMYNLGYYKYTFENICLENKSLHMGDETTKIFINANAECDIIEPEMKALLLYLSKGLVTDGFTERIDNTVSIAKYDQRWKGEFMTLQEHLDRERKEGRAEGRAEGIAEGRAEGIAEGRAESVDAIMKNGYSLEEACKLIGISVEEYTKAKEN